MKKEQVKAWIKATLENSSYSKGQRLPSCREIAEILDVNKITVNAAYRELEAEHLIYGVPRGGFYAADFKISETHQRIMDFKNVFPDPKLVPHRVLGHMIQNALDLHKNDLFTYDSPLGLQSLRDALKTLFEETAVYTKADQIVVTSGTQQALYLLLQVLFQNHTNGSEPNPTVSNANALLVESPTYNLVLKMASQLGIEVQAIERTEKGYDLKALEYLFKSGIIRAFYLMPRHHNPTGYSLNEKQKQQVARLAGLYQVLLIEDDYLADLGSKKGSMPLHYYDIHNQTAYLRSFSKSFMPGMRLGVAVLPQALIHPFSELKRLTDLNTSKLSQAALDLFLRSGMYNRHSLKVRKSYEEKLRRAREIILALSPSTVQWHIPENGIFIWAELNEGHDASLFAEFLAEKNILIATGEDAFTAAGHTPFGIEKRCFRLCISGISTENLKEGLRLLLSELNIRFTY